jgi:predicted transcriptional regulator of viral defense system
VDALISPDWLGGIRRVGHVLEAYGLGSDWRPDLLLEELRAAQSGAARKRLGYMLETLEIIQRRRSGYEGDPDEPWELLRTPRPLETQAAREVREDAIWVAEDDLREETRARTAKGIIKLDPTSATRGRLDKRWGLWINVTLEPAPPRLPLDP